MDAELKKIAEALPCRYRFDVNGRDLTTFTIGGPIKVLVEPDSIEELSATIKLLSSNSITFRVIGCGSNLLIPDSGIDGVVIRLGRGFRFSKVTGEDEKTVNLEVGGSMPLMSLSREVSDGGLSGLEFAGGIPASFGGALWMNAGAHGSEMSEVVQSVQVVTSEGHIENISRNKINYSYRHSDLSVGSVIVGGVIQLKRDSKEVVSKRRSEFLAERKRRQPLTTPSAGSVFRNLAPDLPAGLILEECGCKGLSEGGAEISTLHANWIINPKRQATALNVNRLIEQCQRIALEKTGRNLVPELVRW